MLRKLLAVLAGFMVWSMLWFAANAGLSGLGLLPEPGTAVTEVSLLIALLSASVLASCIAGFTTSWLARAQNQWPVLWLGALLLLVGVLVQTQYWDLMPVWYHLAFLALLVPACLVGSWLKAGRG